MKADIETRSAGRRAPLQGENIRDLYFEEGPMALPRGKGVRHNPIPAATIPWHEAEFAYRGYVLQGHGDQSLECLCQRGGFGIIEYLVYRKLVNYFEDPTSSKADPHWRWDVCDAELKRLGTLSNEEIWKMLGPNVRVAEHG